MATVRTNQAPNPAVFNSDPLEQIHAKHLYDPASSGYALAFLANAKAQRGDNVQQYLDGLRAANVQNMQMQQMETQQKDQASMMDISHKLAKDLGIDFSMLPGLARVFGGPQGQVVAGQDAGRLSGDLMRAKIAAQQASAQSGRSGDKTKTRVELVNTDGKVTTEGPNVTPEQLEAARRLSKMLQGPAYADRQNEADRARERSQPPSRRE